MLKQYHPFSSKYVEMYSSKVRYCFIHFNRSQEQWIWLNINTPSNGRLHKGLYVRVASVYNAINKAIMKYSCLGPIAFHANEKHFSIYFSWNRIPYNFKLMSFPSSPRSNLITTLAFNYNNTTVPDTSMFLTMLNSLTIWQDISMRI